MPVPSVTVRAAGEDLGLDPVLPRIFPLKL